MTSALLSAAANAWPVSIWQDVPVMVGVSGGADSVALMHALRQLRTDNALGSVLVAHFDHNLRPDSAEDGEFVAKLARQAGWEFITARAQTDPDGPDASEAAAREQRYAFFRSAADRVGARYLALAHTKNDNIETILHRILRGTGLRGLAGIARTRRLSEMTTIVRPLLDVSRQDVLAFLKSIEQDFRTDPTNQSLAYTRNRIRHELLPHLREHYNQNVGEGLLRLAEHAADGHRALADSASELLEEAKVACDDGVALDCETLVGAGRAAATEVFRLVWRERDWNQQAMTTDHWRRLYEACWERIRPFELPGAILVEREARWLRLRARRKAE